MHCTCVAIGLKKIFSIKEFCPWKQGTQNISNSITVKRETEVLIDGMGAFFNQSPDSCVLFFSLKKDPFFFPFVSSVRNLPCWEICWLVFSNRKRNGISSKVIAEKMPNQTILATFREIHSFSLCGGTDLITKAKEMLN